MGFIDLAILLFLVLFVLKGVLRGLLRELFALIGLLAGTFLACRFGAGLAAEMARVGHLSGGFCSVTMTIVLFLLGVVAFALGGLLLSRFGKLPEPGGAMRVAGALLALLQGVAVLAVALYGLTLHPWPQALGPALKRARLAPPFVELGEATLRGAQRRFAPADR